CPPLDATYRWIQPVHPASLPLELRLGRHPEAPALRPQLPVCCCPKFVAPDRPTPASLSYLPAKKHSPNTRSAPVIPNPSSAVQTALMKSFDYSGRHGSGDRSVSGPNSATGVD